MLRRFVGFFIAVPILIAQSDPIIKLDVRQVLVPVVVTDGQGRHITGLTESDFEVYEDKVRQRIVSFTVEHGTSANGATSPANSAAPPVAPGIPAASRAPAPSPRTYVICFDMLHTSFESFGRARIALGKLFDRERDTGARFALISLGRQLQIVQTATTDSARIRSRIESKEFVATFGSMETTGFLKDINDVKSRMERYCMECGTACGRTGVVVGVCRAKAEMVREELDARAQTWDTFSGVFLRGFTRLTEELAKLDGPRSIVLVSDGFTLKPGADFYAIASGYVPNSPYFQFDPPYNLQPVLEKSLKIATERDIVVYTIDTRGVYSPEFLPGGPSDVTGVQVGPKALSGVGSTWSSLAFQNTSVLSQLAASTGGVFFHGSNDLLQQFENVLADGRDYYLLAYTPANSAADGKFRHIRVAVKGRNHGVRAKLGYWADGLR